MNQQFVSFRQNPLDTYTKTNESVNLNNNKLNRSTSLGRRPLSYVRITSIIWQPISIRPFASQSGSKSLLSLDNLGYDRFNEPSIYKDFCRVCRTT